MSSVGSELHSPPKNPESLQYPFPHLQNPFPPFSHCPLLLCSPAGPDPLAPHIPEPLASDPLDPKNQENPEAPHSLAHAPHFPPPRLKLSLTPIPHPPPPPQRLSFRMDRMGVLGGPRVYLGRTDLFPTRLGPSLAWLQPRAPWTLLSWLRSQH